MHIYAMSTPRERRRDGTMRLRLQISEYFKVYIKVCQSTICAVMHHDSPIAAMRKSLFRHAKRALPRLRKGFSGVRYGVSCGAERAFRRYEKASSAGHGRLCRQLRKHKRLTARPIAKTLKTRVFASGCAPSGKYAGFGAL